MSLETDTDPPHGAERPQRGGEDLSPLREMFALEERDADGQRPLAGILNRHICPGKFLPAIKKGVDDDNGNAGPGKRQDDSPKDRPQSPAIDEGSFFEITRYILEDSAQQKGLHGDVH